MRQHDLGLVETARELHVTHPAVWAWLNSRAIPRDFLRRRIATWTRDAVPVKAWGQESEAVEIKPFEPPPPPDDDDDVKKNGTDQ